MSGSELREQIFRLLLRYDQCEDLNAVVGIQFQLEAKYQELSCYTGKSPEALENLILEQYPTWVQSQIQPPPDESSASGEI